MSEAKTLEPKSLGIAAAIAAFDAQDVQRAMLAELIHIRMLLERMDRDGMPAVRLNVPD